MEEDKVVSADATPDSPIIDKIRQSLYYFIIAIISFVALIFLPMLGGTVGLGWNLPDTPAGWTVWVAVKVIVATLNLLIFYSFMQQGKLNVKNDPNFLEAQKILQKVKVKNVQPRSPQKYNGQTYGKKGVTIFFTTALATVALTQAILAYNWVEMLTYLFTIIMGIVFGILQMKDAEDYWRFEYLRHARMKEQDENAQNSPANGATAPNSVKIEETDEKNQQTHTDENKEGNQDDNHRR